MHHSDQPPQSKQLRDLAEKLKLGPTGEFPQGKLDESDEGGLQIAVGVHEGKVVIHFGKLISWIGFDGRQARQLAESIRQKSYQAEGR